MKKLAFILIISIYPFALANSSEISSEIYFSTGWCPREDELIELSKYFTLTMNGCCIRRGKATDLLLQDTNAIAKWRHRIIDSYYPYARCDGSTVSPQEDDLQLKEYDEQKLISEENRKKELSNYRANYPKILQKHTDSEFCVLIGNAIREEKIEELLPNKEAINAIKAEAKRRKVSLNLKLIRSEKIQIGMSECDLLASWGTPKSKNRSVGSWGVHIQHIYGDNGPYVYTKNGRISSWQD